MARLRTVSIANIDRLIRSSHSPNAWGFPAYVHAIATDAIIVAAAPTTATMPRALSLFRARRTHATANGRMISVMMSFMLCPLSFCKGCDYRS